MSFKITHSDTNCLIPFCDECETAIQDAKNHGPEKHGPSNSAPVVNKNEQIRRAAHILQDSPVPTENRTVLDADDPRVFNPLTAPVVGDEELRGQVRESLEEVFEYGKSAIGHNPPLVEERILMSLITSYGDRRVEEATKAKITGETSDGYHTFNELYEYRLTYNAALFNEWSAQGKYEVHKSWKHGDGERCFGSGWFIVMAELPTGQISNHYEDKYWDLFDIPERSLAHVWDGHTPEEALKRLAALKQKGKE